MVAQPGPSTQTGMRAILFGATGMTHSKLRKLVRKEMFDLNVAADELKGHDTCFFCLGVSSVGMNEADTTRLTYDLTLAWARGRHHDREVRSRDDSRCALGRTQARAGERRPGGSGSLGRRAYRRRLALGTAAAAAPSSFAVRT
jgi:hypothetical protein